MLARKIRLGNRIPTWTMVLAVILLGGVLLMAYGYYQNSHLTLYVGLAVTIVSALNLIIFSVVYPNAFKVTGHRH